MPRPAPPPGPPWDLPVADAPFAFVDLEMTGLDPAVDRVVEMCVVRMRGDRCEGELTSLVRPSDRIGGAAHIHGLDADALAHAPPFVDLAKSCLALFDGAILVAHAAEWDVRFLSAEMTRIGMSFSPPHYLDTLELARRSFACPSYSLDALCKAFDIPRGNAHRAESDVRALCGLFAKCVEALKPSSARDLWEVRTGVGQARRVIVEACAAAVSGGKAVHVLYRPAGKPPQQMLMILTEVRSDLDPPKVVGYQLPSRSRRELRADRILSVDEAPGDL